MAAHNSNRRADLGFHVREAVVVVVVWPGCVQTFANQCVDGKK